MIPCKTPAGAFSPMFRRSVCRFLNFSGMVSLAVMILAAPAAAQTASNLRNSAAAQPPVPVPAEPVQAGAPSDAALYCQNMAGAASDARLAWQTWNLISLEERLQNRIRELEQKRAEYEEWVQRREKVLGEVEGHVVSIFQRMRPEAAAAQLATLDEDTAVAVLVKLNARAASQILDEMEPSRAAQLTHSMAGLSKSEAQGNL